MMAGHEQQRDNVGPPFKEPRGAGSTAGACVATSDTTIPASRWLHYPIARLQQTLGCRSQRRVPYTLEGDTLEHFPELNEFEIKQERDKCALSSSVPDDRLNRELSTYEDTEVVHDLPAIHHYWTGRYVAPKLDAIGIPLGNNLFVEYIAAAAECKVPGTVHVISFGAGNCDVEVETVVAVVRRGFPNVRVDCLEINPSMLARGRALAEREGVADKLTFIEGSANEWMPERKYEACIANHSLHHLTALEQLFFRIDLAICPDGMLLVNDMIGRNGHKRWPEALVHVQRLWQEAPSRYKWNHQRKRQDDEYPDWDCAQEGFEGIRAQDILPLLVRQFRFEAFLGFNNIIDPFVDRSYGPNLVDPEDAAFIDRVAQLDDKLIDAGEIKPTHMIGVLRPSSWDGSPVRCWKHRTPEFCVRDPNR